MKVHTINNTDEVKFEKIRKDALIKKQRMSTQLMIDARHVIRELKTTKFSNLKLRAAKKQLIGLIETFKETHFENIDAKQIQRLKDQFRSLRSQATAEGINLTKKATPYYRNMTAHAYRIALLNEEFKAGVFIRNLSFKYTFKNVFGLNKRYKDVPMTTMMFIAFPVSMLITVSKHIVDLSKSSMVLEVETRPAFEEAIEAIEANK